MSWADAVVNATAKRSCDNFISRRVDVKCCEYVLGQVIKWFMKDIIKIDRKRFFDKQ